MKSNPSQGQLFIGLFVLILGVLALINNLNFFNMREVIHFWPTIFIVFGLLKMSQASTGKQRLWALLFVALGSLMTLDNMGVITFRLHDWWPVILIVVGIKMLMSDKQKSRLLHSELGSNNAVADSHLDFTAMLGASQGTVTSVDFRSGDITTIMGGVELDLRQANIVDKAILDITCVMGGVVLKVPREWIIVNQITPFMGGVEDKSMPLVDANKQLIVMGSAVMGGIEIKN